MRLTDARALLDRCFASTPEGALRLCEPDEPRFADRPSAVWLEYRWYAHEAGLAEVFLKWKRVPSEQFTEAEVSVLRIHLLGQSPALAACAEQVLEGGAPAPERLIGVFGSDGVTRRCVAFGDTTGTLECWATAGLVEALAPERFEALAAVLANVEAPAEDWQEAVLKLSAERSPRVVQTLVGAVERRFSMNAFRVLSEWGVQAATGPLAKAIGELVPGNIADLWALTALQRRLEAWAVVERAG